jgi:hypothetical protein
MTRKKFAKIQCGYKNHTGKKIKYDATDGVKFDPEVKKYFHCICSNSVLIALSSGRIFSISPPRFLVPLDCFKSPALHVLTKEKTELTKVNTVLTKKNTVLTKFNIVLTKKNTVLTVKRVLTKEYTVFTKFNTVLVPRGLFVTALQ